MVKECSKCHRVLPTTEFYLKTTAKSSKLNSYCKQCNRVACRTYYRLNTAEFKRKAKEYKTVLRQLHYDYLKTQQCAHCGERDPVVLEFHHNKGDKAGLVTKALRKGNLKGYLEEREKCIILCANCHRRVTAEQLGYYKDIVR